MEISPLSISDSFEINTSVFPDERGVFLEVFKQPIIEETVGHSFELRQVNTSVSSRGVLRGIHFADVPPGQAKYVTVPHGSVLDFVIDIRVGSPTFGKWQSIEINDVKRNAVYLSEGLGHAFLSLQDDSVVTYLVSDVYKPQSEHGINPLDPELNLLFPMEIKELNISDKDLKAPTLSELHLQNMLPSWATCNELYEQLARKNH